MDDIKQALIEIEFTSEYTTTGPYSVPDSQGEDVRGAEEELPDKKRPKTGSLKYNNVNLVILFA